MMSDRGLEDAIASLTNRIGADRIITTGPKLALANRATFEHPSKIIAILSPANREQVAICLEVAARYQIAIKPVSTGSLAGRDLVSAAVASCTA